MLADDLERPEPIGEPLWRRILESAQLLRLGAGIDLWSAGQSRPSVMYVLARGLMHLYHPNSEGKLVTVLVVGPGGLLGYHPNLTKMEVFLGAGAVLDTLLLALPARERHALLSDERHHEAVRTWLAEDLGRHLADTYERLKVREGNAQQRLARLLLSLDAMKLLAHVTRQQLADLGNLRVETAVRVIADFHHAGLLQRRHLSSLSAAERQALLDLLPGSNLYLPYA